MKLGKSLWCCALFVAASTLSFADTVTVPGALDSLWQSWNSSVLANPNGTPYWNTQSWDASGSTNKNIGDCLTSSACGLSSTPGALSYLGNSNGQAFSDFYMNNTTGTSTVTMQVQISGNVGSNVLGWYNVADPSDNHVLFSGASAQGTTLDFTPSAGYGFYLYDGSTNTFLSQSDSSTSADQGHQHFALFQQTAGTYYLGAEDLPSGHTDFDYNDVIVKLSAVETPEPGSVALLGSGLLAFGVIGLRKRKAAAQQTAR